MAKTGREVEQEYSRFIYGLLRDVSGRKPAGELQNVGQEDAMSADAYIVPTTRGRKLKRCVRIRTVDYIHSEVKVELTAEDLAFYQGIVAEHGAYAFAIDRQSDGKVLSDEEATGQWGRVRSIHQMAECPPVDLRDLGAGRLYIPTAVENQNRKPGEFMFGMDRRFWFVDGEGKNASGHVGHPETRPRLWQAAELAEKLGAHGCAPKAFLVGELSRWFRDQTQFQLWYKSLQAFGIRLIIQGHGEVTDRNIPMALFGLTVLTDWLKSKKADAMRAKEGRGEGFAGAGTLKFGLDWGTRPDGKPDKRRVVVVPEEWGIIREMVFLIADGELRSSIEASAWLRRTHEARGSLRRPCSHSFVDGYLRGPLLEGEYWCYTRKNEACFVKQKRGKLMDRDITPSGHFRYVIHRKPGVRFEIEMEPEERIPAAVLQQARDRIVGRKPRRREPDHWRDACLFDMAVLRCAKCGAPIEEKAPQVKKERGYMEWTREQDFLLVGLKAQGKPYREIAPAIARLHQERTGRAVELTKFQVGARAHYLGLNGSETANLEKVEQFHADPFRRRLRSWHLYCTCRHYLAKKGCITTEEAKALPEAQHVLTRAGTVSRVAFPRFWQAVCGFPPPPPDEEEEAAPEVDHAALQRRIREIDAEVDEINQAWWTGEFGKPRDTESARGQRDRMRQPLLDERSGLDAQLQALAGEMIRQRQRRSISSAEFGDIQEAMRKLEHDPRFTNAKKREFVRRFVRACRVDLEAGTWEMETVFSYEGLAYLAGQLGLGWEDDSAGIGPDSVSGRGGGDDISLIIRGAVLLAA